MWYKRGINLYNTEKKLSGPTRNGYEKVETISMIIAEKDIHKKKKDIPPHPLLYNPLSGKFL